MRFYVYRLVDPRDGLPFYIGKGQKDRIHQHEKEAAKAGIVCSRKHKIIKDIWQAGLSVKKEKVAHFHEEQQAYDFETDLIAEIGLANLTNVLPGGQRAWSQRLEDREARTVVSLGQMISKFHDVLWARIAEWFRAGGYGGNKFQFTALHPNGRDAANVADAVYNKLMPDLISRVERDKEAREILKTRMRDYGLEIV